MFITAELIHALPFEERVVCNRREAASLIGSSVGYFDKLVQNWHHAAPQSQFLGRKVWDVRALDRVS